MLVDLLAHEFDSVALLANPIGERPLIDVAAESLISAPVSLDAFCEVLGLCVVSF